MEGFSYNKNSLLEKYDSVPTTSSDKLVDSGDIKSYVDQEVASGVQLVSSEIDSLSADVSLTSSKVDNMIDRVGNPFVFKGTVAALSNLPSSGNTVNDTYFVEAEGFMYTWNGTSFSKSSTDVNNQLANDIATAYSGTKADYKQGDIVMYNNQVYVRKNDASAAEGTFVSSNWNAVSLGDEVTNLKKAVRENQTSILEQGNINSSTGNPSNGTGYIRTSEYLDINTLKVTKPAGVGMSIFYYVNPKEENNGYLEYGSWSRNSARSEYLYNAEHPPTATHVKIRWDISGVNPITVETLLATGLTVDYLIPSAYLEKLIDSLETSVTDFDSVAYKQFVVDNQATTIASLVDIGIYRCKSSVASNITDAPSTGAFVVVVMDSLGGGYMQQIYINNKQEIYVRIFNRTDSTVYKDWERLNPPKYSPSILTGKKWVACGDSFTHGDFTGIEDSTEYTFQSGDYAGEQMVYPFFIGRRTGCTVVNEAINGSHMGYVDGRGNKNFSAPNGRYTQIPSDADYITLYFGINDGHQNVPIGTINDNTNTTFYGAWNIVMDYLTTNHPNAKIGIIISNGCDSIDYPNAEIAIAKKWGVSYFDMNGDYTIPLVFRVNGKPDLSTEIKNKRNDQYKVSSTNGHPNVACHEDESTFIQAWLESI